MNMEIASEDWRKFVVGLWQLSLTLYALLYYYLKSEIQENEVILSKHPGLSTIIVQWIGPPIDPAPWD